MATLTCPGCGTQVARTGSQFSKSSEEFCRVCDYPLFWATPPDPLVFDDGDHADTTLRRLPGAGGKQAIATVACPTCMELNPLDSQLCLRCGGPMVIAEPEPVVIEEPEPVVVEEPEPMMFEEPAYDWRPWALLAALLAVAIVILTLLLV